MLLESDSWAVSARRPAKSWVFSTLRQFLSVSISQLSKNPEFEPGLFQQILWKNVQVGILNACTVVIGKFRFRYAFRFRYHSIFRFRPKFRFKLEPKTEICLHAIIPNCLEKHIFFLIWNKWNFFNKHFIIKSDVGLSLA